MTRFFVAAVCAVCVLAGSSYASVPNSITVQGRLTDASGSPLPAGPKSFTFRVFDALVAGNQIWPAAGGEVQIISSAADGTWSGRVGAIEELGSDSFAESDRWLQIEVDGTVLPRVQFDAVPYAYRVETVDGAGGGTIFGNVSIGSSHTNSGSGVFVAGTSNTVVGDYSAITGGRFNQVHGERSFIGGGGGISISDSNSVVGSHSVIVGGERNIVAGDASVIVGGQNNFVNENRAFLGGGEGNDALGFQSVIVGGLSNIASGPRSTIVGGSSNKARGDHSVVGGGGGNGADSNAASGIRATIPGGSGNIAAGNHSFAAGRGGRALHRSAFVWADSGASSFASTGADQFLIRASGGVGIGTNDPEAPLHILETSAGTVTANTNSILVLERSAGGWISLVSADASQRGILFSEPTTGIAGGIVFDAGGANDLAFRTGGNTTRMTLDAAGNLNVTGNITATGTCCASDERFKCNIETLPNALAAVEKLRGVSYEWRIGEFPDRNFGAGQQIGLIAQEVRDVVSQAVVEQSDGYLAVDYTRLVPLLIEGMKEQQSTIAQLLDRVAHLEEKLEQ